MDDEGPLNFGTHYVSFNGLSYREDLVKPPIIDAACTSLTNYKGSHWNRLPWMSPTYCLQKIRCWVVGRLATKRLRQDLDIADVDLVSRRKQKVRFFKGVVRSSNVQLLFQALACLRWSPAHYSIMSCHPIATLLHLRAWGGFNGEYPRSIAWTLKAE